MAPHVGRHVTIFTTNDKLEARRHTINTLQLTPVNFQNLLLNSENSLWAPWIVTTVLFTYSSFSSGSKHLVNRQLTSPTKCFTISRITTLQFPIKFTLIRLLLCAAGPSVVIQAHTTHKVQFYTHKLTLGGGASNPSNTISTHTVYLRDLSHGFYIVNTNIINNTLNLDLHLSLLGYSYVHFDLWFQCPIAYKMSREYMII